jgi:hypothetical protein
VMRSTTLTALGMEIGPHMRRGSAKSAKQLHRRRAADGSDR